MMLDEIVTKSRFAAIAGVSRVRVSQYLAEGKIRGDALVGTGRKARIRVATAMQQLKRNLDPVQHLGANGRARTAANGDADPVEHSIKAARLEQLELANEHARALREAQAGRYARSDDVRQEMGRVAGRIDRHVRGRPRRACDGGCRQVQPSGPGCAAYPADHVPHNSRADQQRRGWHCQSSARLGRRQGPAMTLLAIAERLAHEVIAAAFRPPPSIDYLDWAERHVVFDEPIPGPFNKTLFPYFTEILRALSPSDPCRYVTIVSSAQIGKTVALPSGRHQSGRRLRWHARRQRHAALMAYVAGRQWRPHPCHWH
jgi:hypothetical protein